MDSVIASVVGPLSVLVVLICASQAVAQSSASDAAQPVPGHPPSTAPAQTVPAKPTAEICGALCKRALSEDLNGSDKQLFKTCAQSLLCIDKDNSLRAEQQPRPLDIPFYLRNWRDLSAGKHV